VRGNAPRYGRKFGFDTPGHYEIYLTNLARIEVERNGVVVAQRDVVYNSDLGASVIGAMRWAWNLLDEEQWLPCPVGCCQTQE
jgi:hypothetical protein